MINIVLIPADNRPVSYLLPCNIASVNRKVNVMLPSRELLGGLNTPADVEEIFNWLEKTLAENKVDYVICAMDTVAYGGLVQSRRSTDSEEVILKRIDKFRKITAGCKVFAFSTILRISDSNINEEEKDYWDAYGKLIFKYSYLKHKDEPEYKEVEKQIPAYILDDYLQTRARNFRINKYYLALRFDSLVYAKDDTAAYGLNVQEAKKLGELGAMLHTGCDEVLLLLLTKALTEGQEVSVFPAYSTPAGAHIIPRYEDMPLYKSVKNHIELCGIKQACSSEEADILLLLHTPQEQQNDFALEDFPESENPEAVRFCMDLLENSEKPVVIADVFAANGADPLLAENLLNIPDKLYAYAGWNTASNTIGTALSTGVFRFLAEKDGNFSTKNFKKLILERLADDWAYQAIVRQKIRVTGVVSSELLQKEMKPFLEKLNLNAAKLKFPWDRTFEIEINSP